MTENDWNVIEKQINSACNTEFKMVRKQLVLIANVDLERQSEHEEVLVNYGCIRKYWIQAERQNPGCFAKRQHIFTFLPFHLVFISSLTF